ncbi:MAG: helix-turn-helix domain-containing protein [Marinibacterium sp.]|nr:helix-turn-helix domain-containing protein [Marinibacterium sp.]
MIMGDQLVGTLPGWVPDCARRYLAHTEGGRSIRYIARRDGCHASTILRQIRRIEARRDDPLVDAALQALATNRFPATHRLTQCLARTETRKDDLAMAYPQAAQDATIDDTEFDQEMTRILRCLCESTAVLAVAAEMEKAVVVRDAADGSSTRTAVVDRAVAEAMALKEWIQCAAPGRISRYQITASGRSALSRLLAEQESERAARQNDGFAEAQAPFAAQHRNWGERDVAADGDGRPRRIRYNTMESPLTALARRRDRDGNRFLDETLVRAGERLREDFELAQMGPSVTQNWDSFLTGGVRGGSGDGPAGRGPAAAKDRVLRALDDLGPGLADVALRCCCFLEGLESAEKDMGWSARSGKIVLRIALQRLKRHYDDQSSADQMIG